MDWKWFFITWAWFLGMIFGSLLAILAIAGGCIFLFMYFGVHAEVASTLAMIVLLIIGCGVVAYTWTKE